MQGFPSPHSHDAADSIDDALTAIPLWIAFALGRRAATRRCTCGYGRAGDLAGPFVVATIVLSALVAAVEAVHRLIDPAPTAHLSWVAVAGVVGSAGDEAVAQHRVRVGRQTGSAALVADGLHARTDGSSTRLPASPTPTLWCTAPSTR